jgi:hypothetical protein
MRNLKHIVTAATLAALSLSNMAMAGETLAPGKPASVKQAQAMTDNTMFLGLGLAAAAIGITIAVSSGSGNNGSVSSTSTTS